VHVIAGSRIETPISKLHEPTVSERTHQYLPNYPATRFSIWLRLLVCLILASFPVISIFRPSRYYVTHDDRVLLSSEIGVLPDLNDNEVKVKSRLEPGKMFLVDFDEGALIPDSVNIDLCSSQSCFFKVVQSDGLTLVHFFSHSFHFLSFFF